MGTAKVRLDTEELLLVVGGQTDPDHWTWALKSAEGSLLLAQHEVALDPTDAEYAATSSLDAYFDYYLAPDAGLDEQASLLQRVGAWLGRESLGPISEAILVRGQPCVVRVVVPPHVDRVLHLPLEIAHARGQSMAERDVRFVYEQGEAVARDPFAGRPAEQPLRMLAVFSLPSDATSLALRRERYALKQLIRQIAATHQLDIELRVLQYGVTRDALRSIIGEGGGWDLLHFSGHGLPGSLVLESSDGTSDPVGAAELVDLLKPAAGRLRLITLSACLSAAPSEEIPDGLQAESPPTVAMALVGVLQCAVLAMRFAVTDGFAIKLTAGLYEELIGQSRPLPLALQTALHAAASGGWSTQVPPISLASPALFGHKAAVLTLQIPRKEGASGLPDRVSDGFPEEPRRFVGRVATLSRARQAFLPGSGRTGVLLHGMVGAGKTTCALELAHGYEASRFARIVWHQAEPECADALERLGRELRDNNILLVLDGLEALLTPGGTWRDERWSALVQTLLTHSGNSRTILTSRIRPADLDERQILIEAIHPLSRLDAELLARELPHLSQLLTDDTSYAERTGSELVALALDDAQGHPKLLEWADSEAANPPRFAAQLDTIQTRREEQPGLGDTYLGDGVSRPGAVDLLQSLAEWTNGEAATLASEAHMLFEVLCLLEIDDRRSYILELVWPRVWSRLGNKSEPPPFQSLLEILRSAALLEIHTLPSGGASYQLHPVVAEAGRSTANARAQPVVDDFMSLFWAQAFWAVRGEETQGNSREVAAGARGAVHYLLRSNNWEVAGFLVETTMDRDPSAATLDWAIPVLYQITAAARGTESELGELRRLARALNNSGRYSETEKLLREVVARAATEGQPELESNALNDLVRVLLKTGRPSEALPLIEQKEDASRRGGLGQWGQVNDEAARLIILAQLGQHEVVVDRVPDLIFKLTALSGTRCPDPAMPGRLRELVFRVGSGSALHLRQWPVVLALAHEEFEAMKARGAAPLELARPRVNAYGALIGLGRPKDARNLLEECRAVFVDAGDEHGEALVYSCLADVEEAMGHPQQAIDFDRQALRIDYGIPDAAECALVHNNLGVRLRQGGTVWRTTLAHSLASALIRFQLRDADLPGSIQNLASAVLELAPRPAPFPETYEALVDALDSEENVYFGWLFPQLPKQAPDANAALKMVVGMAEEFAERFRQSSAGVPVIAPTTEVLGSLPPDVHDMANKSASQALRQSETEALYQQAMRTGDGGALYQVARSFASQPGREMDVERFLRLAIKAGVPEASLDLGNLLMRLPGREADAEDAYRLALFVKKTDTLTNLGFLLSRQPGREAEAEDMYRQALQAGDTGALNNLALLLASIPGRQAEAESLYRQAVKAGFPMALNNLGLLLASQPGREIEAEQVYREGLRLVDSPEALFNLGNLLLGQTGREGDAESILRDAINAGVGRAVATLGQLLARNPDRQREAEGLLGQAAQAGDAYALHWLGLLLLQEHGRAEEAEAYLRAAIQAGNRNALHSLGLLLVMDPGRNIEAEQVLRLAVQAGATGALLNLADVLSRQPKRWSEAEEIYRQAISAGVEVAHYHLGLLLVRQRRRKTEACAELRAAVEAGIEDAVDAVRAHCGR